MEIKTSNKTLVFAYETKTNLKDMMTAIGEKPNDLMIELEAQGIKAIGPQIWTYEGSDGSPETEFNLNITVPVEQKGADKGAMKFIELSEYKYVGITHNGPYADFPEVYNKLMEDVAKSGYIPEGSSREVYINCDFEDQTKCVTDIQIGIK